MDEQGNNSNRRILVIDDNRSIHDDFRKVFDNSAAPPASMDVVEAALFGEPAPRRAKPAYQIDSAFQGEEGLKLATRAVQAGRPYAMAFIDVRMPPGWDGIETTARIWQECPDLQVVICTAYSDHSWDEMLDRLGHSDQLLILKKPFDKIEVIQLANALTEKWRLTQQVQSRLADLEQLVDGRTRELLAARAELNTANRRAPESAGLDPEVTVRLRKLAKETDPSVLAEIYEAFVSSAGECLAALRDAARAGEAGGLRTASHALKGASANIGARSVAEILGKLEALGASHSVAGADRLIEQLAKEFENVRFEIENQTEKAAA